MYEGDCNQAVVFLFTLNYLNVRNNKYGLEFFRQILKLEGLRGQRAAIVVRLYYEDGIKAGREMQGARTDLTFLPNGKKVNTYKMLAKKAGVGQGSIGRLIPVYRNRPDLFKRDDLKRGQKAALVIRLFYEEMTQEAKANSLANLKQNTDSANLHTREMGKDVAEILGIQSRKKQALGTGQ